MREMWPVRPRVRCGCGALNEPGAVCRRCDPERAAIVPPEKFEGPQVLAARPEPEDVVLLPDDGRILPLASLDKPTRRVRVDVIYRKEPVVPKAEPVASKLEPEIATELCQCGKPLRHKGRCKGYYKTHPKPTKVDKALAAPPAVEAAATDAVVKDIGLKPDTCRVVRLAPTEDPELAAIDVARKALEPLPREARSRALGYLTAWLVDR